LKIYFNIIPSFTPFSYLYYFEFAAKTRVSDALGEPQKFDTRCSADGSSYLKRHTTAHWGCRVCRPHSVSRSSALGSARQSI